MATKKRQSPQRAIVTSQAGKSPDEYEHGNDSATRPTFDDVAMLLAGDSPPGWLALGLSQLAIHFAFCANADATFPSPKKLQGRLDSVKRAATVLLQELGDNNVEQRLPVLLYLTRHGLMRSQLNGSFKDVLLVLAEIELRARWEANTIEIGPGRKVGEQKRKGFGYLTAREYCALIIIEAWSLLYGKQPSPQAHKVQEAADAYWLACGAPALGRKPEAVERWRAAFETARQAHDAGVGELADSIDEYVQALLYGMRIAFQAIEPPKRNALSDIAAFTEHPHDAG